MTGDDDGGRRWSDLFFRVPPQHPDARDIYLFGIGIITTLRGVNTLTGPAPTARMFIELGPAFLIVWGWIWILVGASASAVACTKHRWPEVDRSAGFAVMMVWWMWGLLYLMSAMFWTDTFRLFDVLTGVVLIFTGMVMSAGVIMGIRKTQEIELRAVTVRRVRELEELLDVMTGENERLRKDCEKARGEEDDG